MRPQAREISNKINHPVCIDPIKARHKAGVLQSSQVWMKAALEPDWPRHAATPYDLPMIRTHDTRKHMQQAGFSSTIAPKQSHRPTDGEIETKVTRHHLGNTTRVIGFVYVAQCKHV